MISIQAHPQEAADTEQPPEANLVLPRLVPPVPLCRPGAGDSGNWPLLTPGLREALELSTKLNFLWVSQTQGRPSLLLWVRVLGQRLAHSRKCKALWETDLRLHIRFLVEGQTVSGEQVTTEISRGKPEDRTGSPTPRALPVFRSTKKIFEKSSFEAHMV